MVQVLINKYIKLMLLVDDEQSNVHMAVVEMMLFKSTISTGIFDMTFKSMVPIFKDNVFMGTIEVISLQHAVHLAYV